MKKLLLLPLLFGSYLNTTAQVYNAGTMFSGYIDIVPDTLLNYSVAPYTHETYTFNIFGDAMNDLEFTAHGAVSSGGSAAYISITSINPAVSILEGRLDSVFVPATSLWNVTTVAKDLSMGAPIDDGSAVWNNTALYLTDHSGSGGGNKNVNDFVGGDKYIGLRYIEGSAMAYGWIRVQCPAEDACYVKDYSFTPSAVGIREISANTATLYPNPVNNGFYLKGVDVSNFDFSSLVLTDIYGKEIQYNYYRGDNYVKIDVDETLSAGSYIVRYTVNGQQLSKKLIKVSE